MSGATARISVWGSAIVGLLGVVLAINAGLLGSDYVGAGVCLIAAALALGVVALVGRADPGL